MFELFFKFVQFLGIAKILILFRFNFLFIYEFYLNSNFFRNLKFKIIQILKKTEKKKEKTNKEEVVTGPARQEPSAGGASLAPANARRLGAPASDPRLGKKKTRGAGQMGRPARTQCSRGRVILFAVTEFLAIGS
jgi:hypothetical protein